jgi:2,5-diketo-D-gluconate reductase B
MLKFNDIPAMGLGTYGRTGDAGLAGISAALEIGYRHIDTAQTYDTEKNVGEAFRRSGLQREDVFITTKVARLKLANKDFLPSLRQSLDTIGVDRVDLTLIHWPSADSNIRFEDYVQSLGRAKVLGLTRMIGVSNFPTALIDRAVNFLGQGEIATNQVEMHPFLQNRKVLECCRRHKIAVTAYMPLAQGRVVNDPVLRAIGKAHGATPNQVSLAWLIGLGVIVIPASGNRGHLESNFAASSVRLSEADNAAIAALDRGERIINPPDSPKWD